MGVSFFLLPLIQVPTLDFELILEIWFHNLKCKISPLSTLSKIVYSVCAIPNLAKDSIADTGIATAINTQLTALILGFRLHLEIQKTN